MQKLVWIILQTGRILKKICLHIIRENPRVIDFEANTKVLVNNNSCIINWKIKYAWKVEIEGFGLVSSSGLRIVNNQREKNSFTLIAYGYKNIIKKRLDLIHLKIILPQPTGYQQVYSDIQRLNDPLGFYLQTNLQDSTALSLTRDQEEKRTSLLHLHEYVTTILNSTEKNATAQPQSILKRISAPVEKKMNGLSSDLKNFVDEKFNQELQILLSNT